MNRIRHWFLGVTTLSLLTACGGSGDAALSTQSAALQGSIIEVDGQTLQRDGVQIRVVETGDRIVTAPDGSFRFPELKAGWYTLDFSQGPTVAALEEGPAREEEPREEEPREEEPREEEPREEEPREEEPREEEPREEEPREEEPREEEPREEEPREEEPREEEPREEEPREEEPREEEPREEEPREEEPREEEPREEEPREDEDERDEDDFERPRCRIDGEGPVVVVKVVLENGEVIRWSKSRPGLQYVRARLERPAEPVDEDVTGQVRVREAKEGRHQSLGFKIRDVAPEQGLLIYLRDPSEESNEFLILDDLRANAEGCAELATDIRERRLPFEAEDVHDLAGYEIEVRNLEGDVLLVGEVPALPERVERDGEPEDDRPEMEPPVHGRDQLEALVDGVFGSVKLLHWGAKDLHRFQMDAGGLRAEEEVKFQIREPETGNWITFATPTARERDREELGYAAIIDTEWHGVLPLDALSAEHLVGLAVRVVRETEEGDVVLLIGEIPELVRE